MFDLQRKHAARIQALWRSDAGLHMDDLADASLVILTAHLSRGRILSKDQRDFHAYRWKSRKPFQIFPVAGRI